MCLSVLRLSCVCAVCVCAVMCVLCCVVCCVCLCCHVCAVLCRVLCVYVLSCVCCAVSCVVCVRDNREERRCNWKRFSTHSQPAGGLGPPHDREQREALAAAGRPGRRREFCHSTASPSAFSRRFNTDRERASAKWQNSRRRLGRPAKQDARCQAFELVRRQRLLDPCDDLRLFLPAED